MYSESLLLPWVRELHRTVPGLAPCDAHVHIGLSDPAGFQATADEALQALRAVGSGGLVFPLKEPGGYAEANLAMARLAAAHDDVHALARLDPADDALGRAHEALDAGAAGLKLHPRGEGFSLADPRLDGVLALASERRLPVMIHAGAGDPGVVPAALARAAAHPGAQIVLAHCAIGGFGRVVRRAAELPNVFCDTSWWNPSDVWALLRCYPADRVLFASDIPFAGPGLCQLLTGRLALEAGMGEDAVRDLMGGRLRRLIAGEEPGRHPALPREVRSLPPELERLYVNLCTVVEPMLRGDPEGQGLELARETCADPLGEHTETFRSVGALLELAADQTDRDPLRPLRTPGFDLVLAAAILARTPNVPLPAAPAGG